MIEAKTCDVFTTQRANVKRSASKEESSHSIITANETKQEEEADRSPPTKDPQNFNTECSNASKPRRYFKYSEEEPITRNCGKDREV